VSSAAETVDRPQDRVIMRRRARRDWSKLFLGAYFVLFLLFLYTPMVLMGVLSFQGAFGAVTFPFRGPVSGTWWKSLLDASVPGSHASEIRAAGAQSFWFSLAGGAIVAVLAFTLSLAFRRRFRGDGIGFYVIMLALMTPGFLLGLGNQLFWRFLDEQTSIWKTALGASVIWGIPFGFLVMLAVWNRYDEHIEEAARDLGADQKRTFREVTLPLVWTGVFGCFLFGFTLTWNDYDRTVLLLSGFDTATLPIQIFGLTFSQAIRPDLYALGAATTAITLLIILVMLVAVTLLARRRGARVVRVEEELGETVGLDRAATVAREG
jgi:putative spermidine/putrescine transport system permease protein